MHLTTTLKQNPLGLNIDFLFGRGFLWARQARLSDWIVLESLRMEIPDLQFPFDARGGVSRFRHTRCLVREIEINVSEAGLQELIARAASQIEGFEELRVRLNEGVAHVSLKLSAFGADSYVSFRLALIPPEPARGDEVHLSLYDYRAFGPLPYPPRVLAAELMTSLLNTPALRPPGRGEAFTLGVAGDILSFHPIKLLLLYLFPQHGWKLPNLSNVMLDGARIRPGQLSLRATSRGERWYDAASSATRGFQIMGTLEGARAVAAYEAKDLFSSVDRVLFDGDLERALEQLAAARDIYGPHPELIARTLDCLLCEPTPARLAEAQAICKDLLEEDAEDLQALLALPTIARLEQRPVEELIGRYDDLATALKARHDLDDWILCELTLAQLTVERDPERAASRLREILKVAPRHVDALELLLELYGRVGEWSGYEEVLKRLTGVYSDRDSLKRTYLELARHLLDRRGEPSEARLYLEKVLRLEPSNLEALDTLGQGYLVDEEPLRALKAFSSAARAAQAHQELWRAAALHHRVATLWWRTLHNPAEALLSVRRALELDARATPLAEERAASPRGALPARIVYLEDAAELSEERERWDEALALRTQIVDLLEHALDEPLVLEEDAERDALRATQRERLITAHRALGELYRRRQREDAAAPHWRRVLALQPQDEQAAEALEMHLRALGQPEQLIAFYNDLIERAERASRKISLRMRLAALYQTLRMGEAAAEQLHAALRLDPAHHGAREALVAILREQGRFVALSALLTSLLLRLQDRQARHEVLIELGGLQLNELDQARSATRSYFEALDLRPTEARALRGATRALQLVIERDGPDSAAPVGAESSSRLLERVHARLLDLTEDDLERAHLLDQIAALATARSALGEARDATARARQLRAEVGRRGERGGAAVDTRLDELLTPSKQPATPRAATAPFEAPGLSFPSLDEPTVASVVEEDLSSSEGGEGGVAKFRTRMLDALKNPASLDELAADSRGQGSALKRLLDRSLRHTPQAGLPALPLKERGAKRPPQSEASPQSEAALTARVDAARRRGEERELAEALQRLIACHLDENDPVSLDPEQLAELSLELGELLFYELERSLEAREHLERARALDPEGLGARTSLLNALESIYEDNGEIASRLALLRSRLERADSEDLATTYRLLLAQVHWDEQRDDEAARALLAEVLERDAHHEAAHRLLAHIALDTERWSEAARHYEMVLAERSGGLDEVELERELAALYLERLHQPDRAERHYEGVLQAAPADAQALEGIKRCQLEREDWEGYLGSLGRELALLIGRPDGKAIDVEARALRLEIEQVATMLRSASSQIVADAAEVVERRLNDKEWARALWRSAYDLWPEHAEALSRRIELDRALGEDADLVDDLEAWSDLLLDIQERFEVLYEAATVCRDRLNDLERARQLLAEAIAMVEGEPKAPPRLTLARRELLAMTEQG